MHTHTRPALGGAADASSSGWVWWTSLKPALLQLAFVYGSQSTFQLPTTAKDISSPIPALRPFTLYHQMLHPYSDSAVLYAHRNLAKQKEQVRFHPKETTEVWRLVMWFCFSSLCASLSEPFVMSCTNSFFAHNISKVTPEAKTEARRSAGWSDQRAWMKTYLLTREDKGTTEQPMKGIVPSLLLSFLSLS